MNMKTTAKTPEDAFYSWCGTSVAKCGGVGGKPGPCPEGRTGGSRPDDSAQVDKEWYDKPAYESPQLKANREIVQKLNNPPAKKLTPKAAKEKEARDLQSKLGGMSEDAVSAFASKHGVDAKKYTSRFNLHREILSVPKAKAELLGS